MSGGTGWALLAGLGLGLGLWSLLSLVPALRRPRLAARVAPYLVEVSAEARDLVRRRSADPLPVVGALLAPALDRARAALSRLLGGAVLLRLRLRQAGSSASIEAFRTRQLAWGAAGAVAGGAASVLAMRAAAAPAATPAALVVAGGIVGVLGADWLLARRARGRLARIARELPTVLEFLTLSLSAGEGVLDAIRRVARVGTGELAAELRVVVARAHSGVPLADALRALSAELALPPLTRAVDQLVAAIERGAPLAEVLRAHAQDARDEHKRTLLEIAGRKEVHMLVPLVFLILPVTVVFAVFPGILVLRTGL